MDTPFEWALAEQMNIGYYVVADGQMSSQTSALIHIDVAG